MTTSNKISALVKSQLPDFVAEEAPLFEAFIKAYYEWLEREGNALEGIQNFKSDFDIDTASSTFFEHIREEIARNLPRDTEIDQTLLLKRVRDIYRAKGSEESFRMLFRAIFDEEIDIYYPEVDVLKVDAAVWKQETSVRLTNVSAANTELFDGRLVTGQTTGAKGRVQQIQLTEEYGINITELFLDNISGEFEDGETVIAEGNVIRGEVFNDTGSLKDVVIQYPGAGHQAGDAVSFIADAGSSANGVITATTDRSLLTFRLVDGGSGYTTNATITIEGVGQDAAFTIASLSNTETITAYTDTYGSIRNVTYDAGPTFVSGGANTTAVSAELAAANVSSTYAAALGTQNTVTGTINAISITNQGYGYYEFPTITIRENTIADLAIDDGNGGIKGENAVVVANTVPGAIRSIRVNEGGSAYSKFETLTIQNNSRSGTTNATAAPLVSGFVNYSGRYVDSIHWIDGTSKLQDDYFYQNFSYVIRSSKYLNQYRKTVNDLLHPGGTKLFGEVLIEAEMTLPTTASIAMDYFSVVVECEDCITTVPVVVSESESQYIEDGISAVFEWDPEITATIPTLTSSVDQVTIWTQANGTISIEAAGTYGDYAANTYAQLANTQYQALGNPQFVSGTGTVFQASFANGENVMIVHTNPAVANSLYTIDYITSNTGLLLTTEYSDAPLSGGTIYGIT